MCAHVLFVYVHVNVCIHVCKQYRYWVRLKGQSRRGIFSCSRQRDLTVAGTVWTASWITGAAWLQRPCGCSTPRPPCHAWWASLSRCSTSRSYSSRSCGNTRLLTSDNMDSCGEGAERIKHRDEAPRREGGLWVESCESVWIPLSETHVE